MTQVKTLQIQQRMRTRNAATPVENSESSENKELKNKSDNNMNAVKEKKKSK